MSENWPRLSQTLRGPRAWGYCQACGGHFPGANGFPGVNLWQEVGISGDTDVRFLWLCAACGPKHVPNAGRLYVREHVFAPFAGVQRFCADCAHCKEMDCKHAQSRSGQLVTAGAFSRSFVTAQNAGGRSEIGWQPTYFYEPAKGCRGFEEAAVEL